MRATKWTAEQKQKALVIAEASSLAEAARETGVPRGTIGRWIAEMKRNDETETGETETKRTLKKIRKVAEQAAEEAKDEVRDYIADKARNVADDILGMVKTALAEAEAVIANGPNADEPKAGWLRAVIGAMAQGVEKHQLLTGKPTTRQAMEGQVAQRYEYDITQKIVTDPETAELADKLLQRAANVNPSMVRSYSKPWNVVSIRPSATAESEDA